MKVRIGISLGDGALDSESPDSVLEFIDDCERWDIDSVWVSDRIAAPRPTLDPVVFMAYLASRMRNMKFGTSALVLPTRHPVVLAKQLATLDFLCKGRLLLVVGIGGDDSRDFEATGVRKEERGKRGDEAIVLMKKLWTEEQVNFEGQFYSVRDLTLLTSALPKRWPASLGRWPQQGCLSTRGATGGRLARFVGDTQRSRGGHRSDPQSRRRGRSGDSRRSLRSFGSLCFRK